MPISKRFYVSKNHSMLVLQKQFPLRLSAAKIIHKCEGDSDNQVAINFIITQKWPTSIMWVWTLDDLFILNLATEKNSRQSWSPAGGEDTQKWSETGELSDI